MNPRTLSTEILKHVIVHHQSLTAVLNALTGKALPRDQPLVKEICYGVCRWYHRLAWTRDRLLKKSEDPLDPEIGILLLVGLYQLEFTRIPDHASVSETVSVVVDINKQKLRGLVNGVLRNYLRHREKLKKEGKAHLSAQFSHPVWFIREVKQAYPEHWRSILIENNKHAPMALRVNLRKTSRYEYLKKMAAANLSAVKHPYSEVGIVLERAVNTNRLPEFDSGDVSVQDVSGQLAAKLLDVQPGMRVLDLCAAPGSKATHLLETYPDLKELVAVEKESKRMQQLKENLLRLHVSATTIIADGADLPAWWDEKPFDRILLDAPCSGTGVIRRHPDIKLLRQEEDIPTLAAQQFSLLTAAWKTLASGGKLLYATCSVLPAENEQVLAAFVEQQPDASVLPIEAPWGHARQFGRQIFPGEEGMDGFYYALLRKS